MAEHSETPAFEIRPTPPLAGFTQRAFSAVSDDVLESALAELVVQHLPDADSESSRLEGLPAAIRPWYIAFLVDLEVLNGGLNQYFFNSSSAFAEEAPAAFRSIGVPAAADILERALALLASHASSIEAAREEGTVEAFLETYVDQPFAELDERYAALEEQLLVARLRYLRSIAPSLPAS